MSKVKNSGDDSIFSEENRLARDIAEGWFKFENVGDKIGGTIRDIFEMPARDAMPAQRCFTIETPDGKLMNVGLKRTNYILSRTDMLQVGDMLGVKFEKEIPPKTKGFHPAKSMTIYSKEIGARTGLKAKDVAATVAPDGDPEAEDAAPSDDVEAKY